MYHPNFYKKRLNRLKGLTLGPKALTKMSGMSGLKTELIEQMHYFFRDLIHQVGYG